MNNEPIAYVNLERWKVCDNPEHCFSKKPEDEDDVPLYTAPKELTDDEIIELFEHPDDLNFIDFARAILKKARE